MKVIDMVMKQIKRRNGECLIFGEKYAAIFGALILRRTFDRKLSLLPLWHLTDGSTSARLLCNDGHWFCRDFPQKDQRRLAKFWLIIAPPIHSEHLIVGHRQFVEKARQGTWQVYSVDQSKEFWGNSNCKSYLLQFGNWGKIVISCAFHGLNQENAGEHP